LHIETRASRNASGRRTVRTVRTVRNSLRLESRGCARYRLRALLARGWLADRGVTSMLP